MKPLNGREIYGNWATLLLPVNQDNSIAYERLGEEIDSLISMQVNGIYSNGTAGEFFNQTEGEFDEVSTLLAQKCNAAQMPFQIGCSHMSPLISLQRIQRVVQLAPSAIQITLPDWVTLSKLETVIFLEKMIRTAEPIGLVLYNPPHAKQLLSPQDYLYLKDSGLLQQLVGCKVPGGDENWYKNMTALSSEFSIFIPGHYMATGYSRGASGSYSNVACLHPGVAQNWYEQMQTNLPAALELEARIQAFMQTEIAPLLGSDGYSNTAADKLLAAIGGWAAIGTRLRWPYQNFSESQVTSIKKKAIEIIPEFFPH